MSDASIRIVEVRSPVDAAKLPRASARIGWRERLEVRELEAIARWAHDRGGASIRLHGEAVAQLDDVLETVPVVTLDVDATRVVRPPRGAQRVRDLALHGLPDRLEETLAAFGGARTLRLDARGGSVRLRALQAMPQLSACAIARASLLDCAAIERLHSLAALELVRTHVDDAGALVNHRALVALRLANVERVTSLRALCGHPNLRCLALEALLHLDSLAPIETLSRLETLAIGRLWQFNVGDAQFITGMTGLRELSLDIGGARKNVEITKRLGLPPAAPFDIGDYGLPTSYELGVQSLPAYLSSVTTVGKAGVLPGNNGGV